MSASHLICGNCGMKCSEIKELDENAFPQQTNQIHRAYTTFTYMEKEREREGDTHT